jgi:hypothetical protein
MAVSILVAIAFPYVDLNAQALLNVENNGIADSSDVAFVGGGGGGGVAQAPLGVEDGTNADAVGVSVEGSAGSGGGAEDDTPVDGIPADMTSSEVDILADDIPTETTSSVGETIDAPIIETNNLFSDTELEQLQNFDIPESIGGDHKK